jgi:hypothetical protein
MTAFETTWVIASVVAALLGGRSVLIWGTLTYLMGWPVFLLQLTFGMKKKTWERRGERLQSFVDKVETMSRPKEYKDFDNVNDLFKQLEKPKG